MHIKKYQLIKTELIRFWQELAKFLARLDRAFDRWSKSLGPIRLARLMILFIIALVFWVAFYHDPHFDYDESNTLRIIQQSSSEISQILNYEHNFPLYYQVVHKLLLLFNGNERIAVWLNFVIWLVSIAVFYRLLRLFFSKRRSDLFLLFYVLTFLVVYYAFYVRMYGLTNLLFLFFFKVS